MKYKLSFLALLCFLAVGILLAGTNTTQASEVHMPPPPTTVPPPPPPSDSAPPPSDSASAPPPATGCGYEAVYCDKYGQLHYVEKNAGSGGVVTVNGKELGPYQTDSDGNLDVIVGSSGETYTVEIHCNGNTFYRKITCPSPRKSDSVPNGGTESKFLYLPPNRLQQTEFAKNTG